MKKLGHAMVLLACLSGAAVAAVPQMPRSIAPSQPDSDPAQLSNLFVASCLVDMAAGRTTLAEQECTRAIALNPNSSVAYKLRGYGYLIDRRFALAQADFEVALKMAPDDAENRAGLGQSFNGLHEYEKAVIQFTRAVKLEPMVAAYHVGLCWTQAGTGRHLDHALAECNRGLKLAPGTAGPFSSRGLVYMRMGRYRDAVADYNASLAIRDAQPSARFGRGLAHLRLGERVQGASDIVEARRADSEIDMLYVNLGLLPRSCADLAKACPPGFPIPARKEPQAYPWLMVSLHGDPDQDFALAVETQRLELMVAQATRLTGGKGSVTNEPPQGHKEILDRLSRTVRLFNQLLPRACAKGRIKPLDCRPFYPEWTARTDLAAAVDAAYAHIKPVWAGVCAGHANRCRLE